MKIFLIIYFALGILMYVSDIGRYIYSLCVKKIKFVVTEEEGYIMVRTRILKSAILMLIHICLLIITIEL